MANRRVRLYEGPGNESTIIGFSASAIPKDPNSLQDFLSERGYETYEYNTHDSETSDRDRATLRSVGSVSLRHVGVEPPLSHEHIREFADWCADQIDPYHNSGYLVDNRKLSPYDLQTNPHTDGDYLAEWF